MFHENERKILKAADWGGRRRLLGPDAGARTPIFLKENEVAPTFKRIGASGDIRIAVAFWGKTAPDKLGLKNKAATRIVCNLESGATNPVVIRALMTMATVRSNARLHAKVYATSTAVIVGSSNASANGLAFEAGELAGWREANIMTADPIVVSQILEWFDDLWKNHETETVTEVMLKDAEKRWLERRFSSPEITTEATKLCDQLGNKDQPLDQDFFKAFVRFEIFNGRKSHRLRESIRNKGVRKSLIDMTKAKKPKPEFEKLTRNGLGKYTADYIVWIHRDEFADRPELVTLVHKRLKDAQVI